MNGNRPRINLDGYGEISDVCIKRKIRNRFQDMGEKIFVQSDDRADDSYTSLKDRADGCEELKEEISKKKKADRDRCASIACKEWIDVRTFGQVFAFKGSEVSFGVRGPVSIHQAVSLSPIDTVSMQITKSVNSEPGKNSKASDTMGTKHRVSFAMYKIMGSVNVQLAEKTGFNQEDADLLKEALKTLFEMMLHLQDQRGVWKYARCIGGNIMKRCLLFQVEKFKEVFRSMRRPNIQPKLMTMILHGSWKIVNNRRNLILYKEEDFLQLSGIQHFEFCRRQWALAYIEMQWQENIWTVEGKILHENAHNPMTKEKRGDLLIVRALPIHSREMGVSGECDVVEFHKSMQGIYLSGHNGLYTVVPVEYKRGKPKKDDSDILQVTAQAMCLEEMLCCNIEYGYIYYGETKHRTKVEFSEDIRIKVKEIFNEMHRYYDQQHTPKVKISKKCKACSLKDICVPVLNKKKSVSEYIDRMISEEDGE